MQVFYSVLKMLSYHPSRSLMLLKEGFGIGIDRAILNGST